MLSWVSRYKSERMIRVWSDEEKFNIWKDIEVAILEGWSMKGVVPRDVVEKARRVKIKPDRVYELERTTGHEVTAFVGAMGEQLDEKSRIYIHFGATSSDIIDTAFSLQILQSLRFIRDALIGVLESLKNLSLKYKDLVCVGRTHGIHAEPTTLGLKFLSHYAEFFRNLKRLKFVYENVRYGKISGAVGVYGTIPPDIEEYVLSKFGLRPEPVATQVVPRDRYAEVFLVLSLIAGAVERIATNIRSMQRTEIGELEEPFGEGQMGSSIMPHKRNPILSENLCGISRIIRSSVISALENIPLWDERDISHSSVERVITPQIFILLDFALKRLKVLLDGLKVNEDRIKENLKISKNSIFSSRVLTKLVEMGVDRELAYKVIQQSAFEIDGDFFSSLQKNLSKYIDQKKVKEIMDEVSDIKIDTDIIFERVLYSPIEVRVKKIDGVFDPEGQAVLSIIKKMGYDVKDVKVGKFFDIKISHISKIEEISENILSNTVIEDYALDI